VKKRRRKAKNTPVRGRDTNKGGKRKTKGDVLLKSTGEKKKVGKKWKGRREGGGGIRGPAINKGDCSKRVFLGGGEGWKRRGGAQKRGQVKTARSDGPKKKGYREGGGNFKGKNKPGPSSIHSEKKRRGRKNAMDKTGAFFKGEEKGRGDGRLLKVVCEPRDARGGKKGEKLEIFAKERKEGEERGEYPEKHIP